MIYLLIAMLIAPLGVFFSYRQGLKDGKRIEKDKELLPVIKQKKRPIKKSEEERIAALLFENINNYDGSSRNQKEVK